MTNKSNKRKFLATTLTATMVAAAVAPVAGVAAEAGPFPDVPADHVYAKQITDLVNAEVIKGEPNGNFDLGGFITRAQAAQMVAGLLDLETGKVENTTSFEDVKDNAWYTGAINALVEKDVIKGLPNGSFGPGADITRGQLAQLLVVAYGLQDVNVDDVTLPYTDVVEGAWYEHAIKILFKEELIKGNTLTTFAPGDKMKRGDFAFLAANVDYKHGEKLPKEEVEEVELAVESVSAINANTLEVTGEGLKNLKAEDITVEDNTVSSVTASADGKKATVKLANALLLDSDYNVEIKQGEETKSFTVKYSLDVAKVEVLDVTLDDDTVGQVVPVKVNGQNAEYDSLAAAGYTVQFAAVDADGNDATGTLFDQTPNVSTGTVSSPLVADSVALDDYTVEVSIVKDGTVVVSDKGLVKVRNLELTTSNIVEELFTNNATNVEKQNSSTLVTGETITLTHMDLVNNGIETTEAYSAGDMLITSSNPAVLSVNGAAITANTPGKAEITFSYGDFEKKVTYTVTNEARVLNKVTASPTSSTIIVGKDTNVRITSVDQYGDFLDETITVEAPVNGIVTVEGDNAAGTTDTVRTNTSVLGTGVVTVAQDGSTFGSGVVLLKNTDGKTVGSFGVKTTAVDNIHTKKFEVVNYPADTEYSTDFKLDMAGDDKVQVAYNQYTSENVFNGVFDLNGDSYTVTYNGNVVDLAATEDAAGKPATWTNTTGQVNKAAIATENLAFQAVGVGSTDVVVYNDQGQKVHQFKITVTNTDFAIQNVTFKPQTTIDYAGKEFTAGDFITLVESSNDDIVKGIALNKPTNHAIRVEGDGTLYIDANGDGTKDVGEKELGSIMISTVSGGKGGDFATAADFDLFAGDLNLATTASDNKGTLVFKVLDNATTPKIVASTSVNVDVK